MNEYPGDKLLGGKIRKIRKDFKLSQDDFAYQLGISQPQLSKIERGVNFPSYLFLYALRLEMDIDLNELAIH